MQLFNNSIPNILPIDGTVQYHENVMQPLLTKHYYDELLKNIEWTNDEVIIFGKKIITKRKVAWYADDGISYTYSGINKAGLPWNAQLMELKKIAENISNHTINACLLNLYHDGNEGMGWHSDNEKTIVQNSAIATLSFGATRKFAFKHKISKLTTSILLSNGSALIMEGETQTNWLHAITKSTKVTSPRISLTFRKMVT